MHGGAGGCREVQGGLEEVEALVSSLEERERQQVYRDDERERELVRALDERTNAEMSFDASQIIVSDLVARLREAEREMQAALSLWPQVQVRARPESAPTRDSGSLAVGH